MPLDVLGDPPGGGGGPVMLRPSTPGWIATGSPCAPRLVDGVELLLPLGAVVALANITCTMWGCPALRSISCAASGSGGRYHGPLEAPVGVPLPSQVWVSQSLYGAAMAEAKSASGRAQIQDPPAVEDGVLDLVAVQ